MKFRIKHAQQVVGFFLLAGALALVAVLVFMGANQRWFAKNYTFFSRFSSAEGLTTGMSVKLKGFEVGKVSNVELTSFNRVRVEVSIYEDYYSKVRPDSVLELAVSPLGLGSGAMNLLPGMNMLPPMEEDSFLPSSDSTLGKALLAQGLVDKPLSDGAIAGIIAQVEPLLIEVRNTAAGVTELLHNVNTAVDGRSGNQIAVLLKEVQKTLVTVEQVLSTTGSNTNTLLVSSRDLLTNLNGITGDIEHLTGQIKDPKGLVPKLLDPQGSLKTLLDDKNELYNQITQILTQVNATLGEVKGLTTYLNQATPQISGMMEDSKVTIKKTGDVMEGLKNNPLLKGGIPETKAPTSTLQNRRDEVFP
jgi:phospholipid/cholesterol/gamma-HCH transport system substrate-binding protein